jgi:4-amino-4-deoxy-L-arabinose transferase-like glycosyltransferase
MGRTPAASERKTAQNTAALWLLLVVLAAAVGLALLLEPIRTSSATYDEVTYLRVAARWWRTGEQTEITRMGSPLSFWKLQQAPVLWVVDWVGQGELIDDPIRHQAILLPLVRAGALWIWLASLGLIAWWAERLYGTRAMALAAWLFVLSPNLIAHGALVTMEQPLLACTTGMFFLFWNFLVTSRWRWFWASAALGGLAFSCKYTTVLFPPILAVVWWLDRWQGDAGQGGFVRRTRRVALGMSTYVLIMILANTAVTGFALLSLSRSHGPHPSIAARFGGGVAPWIARLYETPIPQDWVGLATQVHHQMSGGSSYLLGERRMTGWWYYYFVALAVKQPLTVWLLAGGRLWLARRGKLSLPDGDHMLIQVIVMFLAITAVGSARNYGLRYLLPLAPLAIVWISGLAASRVEGTATATENPAATVTGTSWVGWGGTPPFSRRAGRRPVGFHPTLQGLIGIGLAGQFLAVAAIHPHELTYFNALAGGPLGGRHLLSDSNLDWGQGLKSLARLQHLEPEFRDLTLYYFGDTNPAWYGVRGRTYVVNAVDDHSRLPGIHTVRTRYLAVSASLQWGPWGPAGFFHELNDISPIRMTDDTTIAIYRTADLNSSPPGGLWASRPRLAHTFPQARFYLERVMNYSGKRRKRLKGKRLRSALDDSPHAIITRQEAGQGSLQLLATLQQQIRRVVRVRGIGRPDFLVHDFPLW